ncbi:MAG TPA: DUF3459 domain-containing protein, partial [Ktedonobacterales bacterium]
RDLLRLRRTEPALTDGAMRDVRCDWDDSAHWFTMTRGPITLACNLADDEQRVTLPGSGWREVMLASQVDITLDDASVTLPPDGVAVLRRR